MKIAAVILFGSVVLWLAETLTNRRAADRH